MKVYLWRLMIKNRGASKAQCETANPSGIKLIMAVDHYAGMRVAASIVIMGGYPCSYDGPSVSIDRIRAGRRSGDSRPSAGNDHGSRQTGFNKGGISVTESMLRRFCASPYGTTGGGLGSLGSCSNGKTQ